VAACGLENDDLYGGWEMCNIKKYIELAQSGTCTVCVWGAGYLGTKIGLPLLYKRGIKVDFYCDNNCELWGREVIDGIPCVSPKQLQEQKDKVICFVLVGTTKIGQVSQQVENMGICRIVRFDDLFLEEREEYFPFMKRKQVVFYTCIVGGYDDLQEPLSVLPDCDYYLISDQKPKRETVFQYLDINRYLPRNVMDNTRKNRYCKINAHKIFPQYKYSVYFDGQIQMNSSIVEFIKELPKTRIIAGSKNNWNGLYMEAMRVLINKRDAEEVVKRQIEHYWLEGMPENFGSILCNILLREHNNPICRKLMEDWWEQVEHFSRRDMISFPYVLWKNGYFIDDVKTIESKIQLESKFWKDAGGHNQPRVVYDGKKIY